MEAPEEVPTAAQLRKLRVVDLRKRLQSAELSPSGNKEDLISRLRKYYREQQAKAVAAEEEREAEEREEEREEEEEVREEETVGVKSEEERAVKGEGVEGESVEEEGVKEEGVKEEGVKEEVVEGVKEEGVVDVKVDAESGEDMSVAEEGGGEEGGGGERGGEEGEEAMQTDSPEQETAASSDQPVIQPPPDDEPVISVTDDVMAAKGEGVSEDPGRGRDVMEGGTEDMVYPTTDSQHGPIQPQPMVSEPTPVDVSNSGPAQSMDQTVPTADVRKEPSPAVTSDYYSDSAREEISQNVPGNPQIAQATLAIVPPTAAELSLPSAPAVVPSNQSQTTTPPQKEQEPKGKKKKKRRGCRRHGQGAESGERREENKPPQPDVEIEYVQESILTPADVHYRQFHKIFEAFKLNEEPEATPKATPIPADDDTMSIAAKSAAAQKKQRDEEAAEQEEEKVKEPAKLSKKKLRKLNRLSVAQLKQLVDRPDVVEMHDVTAQDPKLLIHLKSARNTVPVPRHWCFKRKYLQGKRGIEKPPFNLPDFIKATGIMEMRQALEEKEDAKSLKQKTRERVRPKMGKLTIDYQKLHDAFFRWQTKPKMTIHGDLYYEGKEFETRLREKKPGDLSDELRRALGMPTGMGKQKFPPPWLVAMQRYGPPPSYPNLKIPGLNAPIPEGCSFGYFVGGWGKPPVDEVGRPLYGDVFGLDQQDNIPKMQEEEIDKQLWGEMESEEEMEEDDESEEEGEMKPEDLQAGLITPIEGGLVTPSGLTSIPAGLETPEMIQLRKKKIEEAMEQGGDTPALYTVLPEKAQSVGGAVMGSSHVYDISAAVPTGSTKKTGGGAGEGVEVALDPSELDLDAATMTARYEEQLKETKLQKEDLSDMVAEHAAKQKKRKRATTDQSSGGKASKKLKEFKF